MFLDKDLEFSDSQDASAFGIGDNAPTNDIDFGDTGDRGIGEDMEVVVQVDTTIGSAGGATVQFQLQTDTVANFASPTTVVQSDAIAIASLTAGVTAWKVKIPSGMERYARLNYNVGTAALNAGAFSAFLVKDRDAQQYLPDAT